MTMWSDYDTTAPDPNDQYQVALRRIERDVGVALGLVALLLAAAFVAACQAGLR